MPLPENNTAWPPLDMRAQLEDMRVDDAWYSGDKAKLRTVYAREGFESPYRDERDQRGRPLRFWERPRQAGHRDYRLHVPLPADIAAKSASLLFSEPPRFAFDDGTAQERFDTIADEAGLNNVLREAAEVSAALGGVVLRATWNRDLARRPLPTAVHADGVIPRYTFGVLTALTLWREVDRSGQVVRRHLECHEPGRVLHALYEGTADNLGMRIPLTESVETQDIAESLDPDGPGDTITTGVPGLTCVYVPNQRPNRKYRGSMLGRSDWQDDGVRDMFMSLDETYTSWMRDIRLAKARIIVPNSYLQSEGMGKGVSFDADREVWTPINAAPTSGEGLTLNQFAIRVAEHEQTWKALTRQAVQSCGYAAQSFGLGDKTAVTATEVTAEERSSLTTRAQKAGYWTPELAAFCETLLALDSRLGFSTVTPERPRIEFGDSVSEDPKATAETLSMLEQAKAISTETKVRWLHPDWDDTAVREEVDRIHAETGVAVADPTQTGRGTLPGADPDEDEDQADGDPDGGEEPEAEE